MSDRIAVIGHGEVHQLAAPEDVYRHPSNAFVAHFVGDLNYFEGKLATSTEGPAVLCTDSGLTIRVDARGAVAPGVLVGCGIRPELVQVGSGVAGDNCYRAHVRALTFRGSHYWADLLLPSGDTLIAMLPSPSGVGEGDDVAVGWDAAEMRIFPARERASLETST